ncbi:stage III sporulation protein AF [Bacillaceae bacterium SIJ1]|uniref:stage III sporulation protein AF n=1 Tax=Litoribacterium kuwaitense TaxID=1398745 RepID=UPI0013E9A7CE|nr:stage III sporulation protein AF [Litoribacterium kuwaitense]NGP43602.1 stage III sporulation protein AF [Litoribacterium kuwaitense]
MGNEVTKDVELRKKEIDVAQRAYISEQVAVQLKKQAQEELKKDGVMVRDIAVDMKRNDQGQWQMEHVKVSLGETSSSSQNVEPVVIEINGEERATEEDEAPDSASFAKRLSQLWGIEEDRLMVTFLTEDRI